MRILINKNVFFIYLTVLFLLSLIIFLSKSPFLVKDVAADMGVDACKLNCIRLTGDPDYDEDMGQGCKFICEDDTYGCLASSINSFFSSDIIYTQQPERWCKYLQTNKELCYDKCIWVSTQEGYPNSHQKCTNVCNDAEDRNQCETIAPLPEYFNNESVNTSFCAMFDVNGSMPDFSLNESYVSYVGEPFVLQGDISFDKEISDVLLFTDSNNYIDTCNFENIVDFNYSFSCTIPSTHYNNIGLYQYKVRVEDSDNNLFFSNTVNLEILQAEISISIDSPQKTFNNNFVIKGITTSMNGVINQINVKSNYQEGIPQTINTCSCDDGICNQDSEKYTCNLNNLVPNSSNYFCISATDDLENQRETCRSVNQTNSIVDNLSGYWSFNSLDPDINEESSGFGSTVLPMGFEINVVEGFLGNARSFADHSYLLIDDSNKHYSFSDDDSNFLVEAYVKIDQIPYNYPFIIAKMDSTQIENEDMRPTWELGLNNAGGVICSIYSTGNPVSEMHRVDTESEFTIETGQWEKVGCSWNASTRELAIYIDDIKVKSSILDEGIKIKDSSGPIVIANKYREIDNFGNLIPAGDYLIGSLDEVKIFDYTNHADTPDPDPDPDPEPEPTIIFSNINTPALVKGSSIFELNGEATYSSNIYSVQYRLFNQNQGENDNWENCLCSDGECNSNNEDFSCNITGLENNKTYVVQLRISYNGGNNYIDISKWGNGEIFRYDDDDLVAWWPFGQEEIIKDYSGNSLDGLLTGENNISTSDQSGSKTNIFNTGTRIEIQDNNGFLNFKNQNDRFRLEMRVKPYPNQEQSFPFSLISKRTNSNTHVWDVYFDNESTIFGSILSLGNHIKAGEQGSDKTDLLINEWNNIIFSYGYADQTILTKVNNNRPKTGFSTVPFSLETSFEPVIINHENKFLGEIDDIKIFAISDVKAPQVQFGDIGNLERVTNKNFSIDLTLTDETGIDALEYAFLRTNMGTNLDGEDWVEVQNPTIGDWGDKNLQFNIQKNNLEDGVWYLYIRATDSNGLKHFYTNDGWYTFVGFPTPSAMPYLRFVIEAEDTTPPHIFAHPIIPNPTVDKSPGVRGYVKDYLEIGVGDSHSNIQSIEYKINNNEWISVPPIDGSYDSPMEEFFFKFEDLIPGEYTLKIRALDFSGNSTDDNNTTYQTEFIIYEPEEIPEVSVIEKVEDFNNHDLHDVLFSDGVWGNGILRLRQEIDFTQENEYFTNSNDFGWQFGDNKTTVFEAIDGNIWVLTQDNRLNYYDLSTKQFVKYPLLNSSEIREVKDFVYNNRRYLLIKCDYLGTTIVYDLNNTPLNINDDPQYVRYVDKEGFELYSTFSIVDFDTRNGKFAYFANVMNKSEEGIGNFFIWIDTKGTIMDLSDDTYVVWGRNDNLFYRNDTYGYHQDNDFTAAYFDQEENIFYAASYSWSIYQCTDNGTPENKADDSCQRFGAPNGTYGVFSILKDPHGYYWFGGNEGLTRINRKGTLSITDDEKVQVIRKADIAYEDIAKIKWIQGNYPVGDEVWMLTRSGYIRALEYNYTYNDTLDDTTYVYKIKNVLNRQGGFGNFVMPNRNTIYLSLQGFGIEKISINRRFADTNIIEMLPIPPDGILAINFVDLEQVLGSVTQDSLRRLEELVSFEVSNDAGVTWYPISIGNRVNFPTPDYKLKVRIILNKGSSPIIDLIKLSYISYPERDTDSQCDIRINRLGPVITSLINSSNNNTISVNFLRILTEPNIQRYILEYWTSNNASAPTSININPFISSYSITNLLLNTEYFFKIKAVTDCTESNWSNVLSATISPETVSQPIIPIIQNPRNNPSSPTSSVQCGQLCNSNSDCSDENNICVDGRCQLDPQICLPNEQLDANKCSCVKETSTGGMCGDSCTSDYQCTQENNRCIDGKCRLISCPGGLQLSNNGCMCIQVPRGIDSNDNYNIFNRIGDFFRNIGYETTRNITYLSMGGLLTSYLVSIFTSGTNPFAYLYQVITGMLGIFSIKKKSQEYGMVYNSVTKEPINRAIVRIYNKHNKLISTEVTNEFGIFEAKLEKDDGYRIEVMARNYKYPSKIIVGNEDGIYQNIYTGGSFSYDPSYPINYSIPLDPLDSKYIEYSKASLVSRVSSYLGKLQSVFLVIGLAFSILLYINNNTILNLVILGIYVLVGTINIIIYIKNRKAYGIVKDTNNNIQSNLQLILRELEFNNIHSQRITDENGKYRFIVPAGKYRIELANSSYEIVNKEDTFIDEKDKKSLIINKDLIIRRV